MRHCALAVTNTAPVVTKGPAPLFVQCRNCELYPSPREEMCGTPYVRDMCAAVDTFLQKRERENISESDSNSVECRAGIS